jgi:hypothetical protein
MTLFQFNNVRCVYAVWGWYMLCQFLSIFLSLRNGVRFLLIHRVRLIYLLNCFLWFSFTFLNVLRIVRKSMTTFNKRHRCLKKITIAVNKLITEGIKFTICLYCSVQSVCQCRLSEKKNLGNIATWILNYR